VIDEAVDRRLITLEQKIRTLAKGVDELCGALELLRAEAERFAEVARQWHAWSASMMGAFQTLAAEHEAMQRTLVRLVEAAGVKQ